MISPFTWPISSIMKDFNNLIWYLGNKLGRRYDVWVSWRSLCHWIWYHLFQTSKKRRRRKQDLVFRVKLQLKLSLSLAITLVVWFRILSTILLENLGGGSCCCCSCCSCCSCCCSCYYVKVKSTPSLDLALGVWQKFSATSPLPSKGVLYRRESSIEGCLP